MRTIAIINQKGGCGKTTSAINLAAVFARRGFRTLLVDLDPQSHCAAGLGVPEEQIERDVTDALLAPSDARLDRGQLLWRVTRGLDLLPSRMRLAGLESSRGGLADAPDKDHRLASVIDRLSRADAEPGEGDAPERVFDICLIDCPPSIGLLTYNALVAARELIVPVETSYFALKGAEKQVKTMRSIGRRLGVRNRARLLPTLHDATVPISRDLLDEMRSKFGGLLIPTIIRADAALREAASVGRPVIDHAPDSTGSEDYTSLCEWLEEHARIDKTEFDENDNEMPRPIERPASVTVMRDAEQAVLNRADRIATPPSRLDELTARVREMKRAGETSPMSVSQRLEALRTVASVNAAPTPTQALSPAPIEAHAPAQAPPVRVAPLTLVETAPEPARQLDAGARALLGSRPTARGVLFVLPLALGDRVCIAGDFNGWQGARHEMRRNPDRGVYELEIPMEPGEYQYRLVIDGRWSVDPYAGQCALSSSGEPNSVVRVPARAGA